MFKLLKNRFSEKFVEIVVVDFGALASCHGTVGEGNHQLAEGALAHDVGVGDECTL